MKTPSFKEDHISQFSAFAIAPVNDGENEGENIVKYK